MVVDSAEARETLITAVYPELRMIAARLLRLERDDHTLQRTALVHEALIRLFGRRPDRHLPTREFLSLAGHQMRQVLIDYGRKHRSQKRGGGFVRVPLFEADLGVDRDNYTLLALNRVLDRLGRIDPRALSVVEMKFFCGYTNGETAEILGISDGTVESDWQFARSWLFGALRNDSAHLRI